MIDWSGLSMAVLFIGGSDEEREELIESLSDGFYLFYTVASGFNKDISGDALKYFSLGMYIQQVSVVNASLKYGSYGNVGAVSGDYRDFLSYRSLDEDSQNFIDMEMPRYDDYGLVLSIDDTGIDNPVVLNVKPDIKLIYSLIVSSMKV